jgi:hypothetical protein
MWTEEDGHKREGDMYNIEEVVTLMPVKSYLNWTSVK